MFLLLIFWFGSTMATEHAGRDVSSLRCVQESVLPGDCVARTSAAAGWTAFSDLPCTCCPHLLLSNRH